MASTNTPARRKRGGRPTKLTVEVHDKIVAAVRAGNYVETAAAYAGVHPTTVFRWLREAEEPGASRAVREFRYALDSARAESEVRVIGQIQRVIMGGQVVRETVRTLPDGTTETERTYAQPNGNVALEFAARAFPDRWARRSAIEVTGEGGGPVQVEHTQVIASLAERLHELAAGAADDVMDAEIVDGD
jgi:transposase-like protein